MKPSLFKSKSKLKRIPFWFLAIVFFTVLPFISVWLANVIGDGLGCNINEGGTDSCIRMGIPLGNLLSMMVASGWFLLLTIPIGALCLLVFIALTINDCVYHLKKSK